MVLEFFLPYGGNVPTAGYVAFRGNITKVAMEHMRHASALERLTAGDWEEVLNEVIAANEDVAQPPALQDGAPFDAVPELDDVERGDDGQPRPDQAQRAQQDQQREQPAPGVVVE